jgi:hypothetical protein
MVKGGMIGVKIVGLVGKRMEGGGWGWDWRNAGWLYRGEGRQTPRELGRKSGKGGCARIGEWPSLPRGRAARRLGSGGLYVKTGQMSLNGEEALGQSCYAVGGVDS